MTADHLDRSPKPAGSATRNAGVPNREAVVTKDPTAPIRPPKSRKRHTFGMPAGSVRALLTLMIVAVAVNEAMSGVNLPIFWVESLMIALAHYFTTRRLVDLPTEVLERLQEEGHISREAQPLYLPKHSIRLLILISFAGLGAYLFQSGRLAQNGQVRFDDPAASLLLMVSAYLIGMLTRPLMDWWKTLLGDRSLHWWDDLKGIVVLGTLSTAIAWRYLLPNRPIPESFENLTLGLVLFYFGSR